MIEINPRTVLTIFFALSIFLYGAKGQSELTTRPAKVEAAPRYTISVLTFEPGRDSFAAFGHTAILVKYEMSGQNKVYNFGTFNFQSPDIKWRYMQGDLRYWLSVSTLRSTLKRYRHFGRGATLQQLDLAPERAAWLAKTLETQTHPDLRHYQYRHFNNNCCIRVRDLIDQATGGILKSTFDDKPSSRSYRAWTRYHMESHSLIATAVDFVLGPFGEKPITRFEEQYIPSQFSEDLGRVQLYDPLRPLVVRGEHLEPTHPAPAVHKQLLPRLALAAWVLLFLLGTAIPVAFRNRISSRRAIGVSLAIWALTSGILGTMLTFFQFTSHLCTHGNENHLITPLSHLWLIFPGIVLIFRGELGPRLWRATRLYLGLSLAVIAVGLTWKVVSATAQDNLRYLLPAAAVTILLLIGLHLGFPHGQSKQRS